MPRVKAWAVIAPVEENRWRPGRASMSSGRSSRLREGELVSSREPCRESRGHPARLIGVDPMSLELLEGDPRRPAPIRIVGIPREDVPVHMRFAVPVTGVVQL